jgi:acyl dehydratase
LIAKEELFLDKHLAVCTKCEPEAVHGMMALDLLRKCALEAEPRPNFDERVLRRFKAESLKVSVRYWSPAFIGAAVAGLVVLAALQMIAQPSQLPSLHLRGGEARNFTTPAFPQTIDNAKYRGVDE